MTQPIVMYLAVLSMTLASCNTESITASDEITIIDHSVPTFSALEVSDNFTMSIKFSDTVETVTVHYSILTETRDILIVSAVS